MTSLPLLKKEKATSVKSLIHFVIFTVSNPKPTPTPTPTPNPNPVLSPIYHLWVEAGPSRHRICQLHNLGIPYPQNCEK